MTFAGMDRATSETDRVPIHIGPAARDRLIAVLWTPEFHGVGYTAFINRACEIAEAEVATSIRVRRISQQQAYSRGQCAHAGPVGACPYPGGPNRDRWLEGWAGKPMGELA